MSFPTSVPTIVSLGLAGCRTCEPATPTACGRRLSPASLGDDPDGERSFGVRFRPSESGA